MSDTSLPKGIIYRFAFSKITVIVLCAILCACLVISVANDLFAFVKPSESIALEITEPLSLYALSKQLQRLGVIENPFAFLLYATLKNRDELLESFSGTLELNSDMSYREILNEFINF